jgi:hypothetical protein
LEREFEYDYWDEIFGTDFDGNTLELYYRYKELSGLSQTPSEFDIRYERNESSKYLYLLERLNVEKENA